MKTCVDSADLDRETQSASSGGGVSPALPLYRLAVRVSVD